VYDNMTSPRPLGVHRCGLVDHARFSHDDALIMAFRSLYGKEHSLLNGKSRHVNQSSFADVFTDPSRIDGKRIAKRVNYGNLLYFGQKYNKFP